MSNFKRSAIAIFVSTAIALPAASVFADTLQQMAAEQGQAVPIAQETPTVSGMRNQYNEETGAATFSWAPAGLQKPNIAAVAAEFQLEYAATFYLNALTGAAAKGQLVQLTPVMVNSYQSEDGIKTAKFRQQFMGIEVFNKEYNILMDAEFNLVAGSGQLSDVSLAKTTLAAKPKFAFADDAIRAAYKAAGGNEGNLQLSEQTQQEQYAVFSASADSGVKVLGEPRVKPVFFEKKGKLIAAQYVELETSNDDALDSDFYSYVIAGDSGEVLFKNNLKAHAASFDYRIYADSNGTPWDGPHGNVVPATSEDQVDVTAYLAAPLVKLTHGPISTKDAWLKDDATTTSGNNVFAYVDAIAPDGFTTGDYSAEVTGPLVFDYKYRTSEAETSVNNRKAAIVNLFYMNNYLHDLFYDYGFDEKAGNAQLVNFGRGGVEGDPLKAEVQDNSGFNNANMSTPADGRSPRMQMFLWDSKDAKFGKDYGVTAKATDGTNLTITAVQRSGFGQGQFDVSGQLVEFVDIQAPTRDACQVAATPASLKGKIAILDRGTCTFTVKVKQAQDAGALAVIVVNNSAAGLPGMGGTDATVKIPNVGISQAEGAAIYAALKAGKTIDVRLFNNKPFKDSSWDNAIVAHEWGHYISNRLVGNGNGLYNQQGGSMGEGWGDFHALMTVSDAKDLELSGNDKLQRAYAAISYVDSFYHGIRQYPYAADKKLNPLTFSHIEVGKGVALDQDGNAEVHSAGELWAAALWEGFVNLVNDDRHSFNDAKHRMLGYLVNGYKMTPVGPTYTEARDAVLAAAYAKDPADYKLLLKAFAARGMGLGAKSPHRDDPKHTGVVESTKTELNTFEVASHSFNNNFDSATAGFCSNNGILDNGETGTVSFKISNRGSAKLAGVKGKIEVTSGHAVTLANNGEVTVPNLDLFASASTSPLQYKLSGAKTADNLTFKLSFPGLAADIVTSDYELGQMVNLGFKAAAPVNMQATDNTETYASLENFKERVLAGGDMAKNSRVLEDILMSIVNSAGQDLGNQYMLIRNNGFSSDVAYETKAFEVGYAGDFVLSFWHLYAFEDAYDGGVVEISINGSDWVDVTKVQIGTANNAPVYASFSSGGYNNKLAELLPGRKAFTGLMPSLGGVESVNFGTALNGNQVKLRFRAVADSNTANYGWLLDNIKVSNVTTSVYHDVVAGDSLACSNRTPIISKVETSAAAVNEAGSFTLTATATDRDTADKLTYSWKQVSGTAATLANAGTATATVTAPSISTASEDLVFEVSVSDGTATTKSTVTVKVNDVPVPVEVKPVKKGGGSFGWFTLLLAPLALLRRRNK